MKTEQEVEAFKAEASRQVYTCEKCHGHLGTDCVCTSDFAFSVEAFEACIPRDFWRTRAEDVEYNRDAFEAFVLPYTRKLTTALRRGYGLLLSGPNGVGKTMFMSFVLSCAIRRGRSVYYTTMLQLDHHIKQGFRDHEAQQRLEWMLTSDFLGLDEMGKEQLKASDQPSFIRSQVERILKHRFDESKPVILATNLSATALGNSYGNTIKSIITGKHQTVVMEPGDIREMLADRMADDMGYGE
ncbi:MAG: ATP-binding protein [bacterium]